MSPSKPSPDDGTRLPDDVMMQTDDDLSEQDWLRAAVRNPAFADLAHPAEDIYSPTDGEPFDDGRQAGRS